MTHGTIAGVVVWVALVSAPIFIPLPTPRDEGEAVRALFEARAQAHEQEDEAALRATTAADFRTVAMEGATVSERAAHQRDLRLDFVQFVTPDVASVGASWEVDENPDGTRGTLFYVVVKKDGRWLVSNVLTASSKD